MPAIAGRSAAGAARDSVRYIACWDSDECEVFVDRRGSAPYKMDGRNDIRDHSPTGISWGYDGSGPSQCALGLLADFFGNGRRSGWADAMAARYYAGFRSLVIARLPMGSDWELTDTQVRAALRLIDAAG